MAIAPDLVLSKLILQPPLTATITAKLEYKYYLDASWTLINASVTVATDGSFTPQTISGLETNKQYIVRATNNLCETIWEEYFNYPCNTTCPNGYTLSPDGTYCYQVQTTAATPPSGVLDTLIAKSAIQYSTCGSYIYADGYNVNGTGTSTQIPLSNPFWFNGVGSCADGNTSDGEMNKCAVWASSTTNDQDIGFSVCLNLEEETDVYFAMGADNSATVKVNGTTIIEQDESAINTQYGITGACFKIWHQFPYTLPAGLVYLELFGHNVSSAAAVGLEIYQNTAAEIIAATDIADLTVLFSTRNEVGNPVLLGTDGYSCPLGYSVVACESPVVCKKIITTDTIC